MPVCENFKSHCSYVRLKEPGIPRECITVSPMSLKSEYKDAVGRSVGEEGTVGI